VVAIDGVIIPESEYTATGAQQITLLAGVPANTKVTFFVAGAATGGGGGGGGSGTVTSVAVSGGTTGLTTSGGPITFARDSGIIDY
jgi:hypothetical protein